MNVSVVHDAALTMWSAMAPSQQLLQIALDKRQAEKAEFQEATEAFDDTVEGAVAPVEPTYTLLPTEEDKKALRSSKSDVVLCIANLHRASFGNALPEDSTTAAEAEVALMMTGPDAETVSYSSFQRYVRHLIIKKWADPRCLSYAQVRPGTSNTAASTSRPGTSLEKNAAGSGKARTIFEDYVHDLVRCVVDDRETCPLLPLSDVWTRASYPLPVEHPFSKYAKLSCHPQYPSVYDHLWEAVVSSGSSDVATKEEFTNVVRLASRYYFTNTTDERSEVMASWLWYEAICVTGIMSPVEFRRACVTMVAAFAPKSPHKQATRQSEEVAALALEAIVAAAKDASCEGAQWIDAMVTANPQATLLKDPQELFLHDELEGSVVEETHFTTTTPNRILVTGEEGVGKTSLAKQLAESLNSIHLDAEELAIKAADSPFDILGSQVRQLVASGSPIPLYLQAALIKRCLLNPATQHRGYVCGDIPPVNPKTTAAFIDNLGLEEFIPQAIVRMDCPPVLMEARLQAAKDRNDSLYQTEIETREAEQGEIDARALAEQEAKDRARRNAELASRKQVIENKDDDLTPEEQATMEQQEEEEPEVEPEYDEEGIQLEPEEIAERKLTKKRATERRRFLSELHQQIVVGRRQLIASGEGTDPIDAPILNIAKEICEARRRIIHVGCAEDPSALSNAVIERLSLVKSCVPSAVPLPEGADEDLPSGDSAAYGEAVLVAIDEAPAKYPFSRWGKACPVTYMEDSTLFDGIPDYSVMYRNRVYFLAGSRKMELFIHNPHRYLQADPTPKKSVLLIKGRADVFNSEASATTPEKPVAFTNASSTEVEAQLAKRLNLTATSLRDIVDQWRQQQEAFSIRQASAKDRTKADLKRRKEADDRLNKRLEAEAKRRKKEEKAKKKPKKGAAEVSKVEEAIDDEDNYVEPEEVIETTDMRVQREIEAKKRAQEFTFAPQLISLLNEPLSPEDLDYLFNLRALPETVVVLKHKVPKAINIDATEDELAEAEENAEDDSDEEDEEEPEEEFNDDGEVIPRPPKVVDLAEPKQYRKYIRDLLQKLTTAAETAEDENGAPEEIPQDGEDAPPRPSQPFVTKVFNVYDRPNTEHLISDIVYQVKPCLLRAEPLPDGEEVIAEDEPLEELEGLEEEGDLDAAPTNPLLIPGMRARHQYGRTGPFCPVTLAEKNVLIKGDISICAVYDHDKYIFATQQEMDTFLVNPSRFIPHGLPVAVPPPRLWVLGPKAAGKVTVVSKLSTHYNIPIFASTELAYFDELLAAAASPAGSNVRGLDVPSQEPTSNWYLARAISLRRSLVDFEEDQTKKTKKKADGEAEQEERERLMQEGEEVDELDEEEELELEEVLAFEPEEEEMGIERKELAQRRICAALTRIEPFASRGYILAGSPTTEGELQVLLDNKAYPDVVVNIRVSSEEYVKRRIDAEVAAKEEEFVAKTKEIERLQRREAERARRIELAKWRRRNIGAEDEEPEEEEADIPEEPEQVQVEQIQAELEAEYEDNVGAIAAVLELIPEKRLQLVEINGDGGFDTVLTHCQHALMPFVDARRSLVEAAQVVSHSEAIKALTLGSKSISSFQFADPVTIFERRQLADKAVEQYALRKKRNAAEDVEEEVPEVDDSQPTKPKTKIIIETNEDGEDEEVEVAEEEEEAADDEEEPEEPEPEPELSPEEIEEMQTELKEKKRIEQERTARKTAYFRNRVYTFDSEANLLKFIQSPVTYWDQPPPLPQVPSIVTVAEAPLTQEEISSGKRLMGHHVANSTSASFVDLPKLLKWALLRREAFPGAIEEALLGSLIHSAPIHPTTLQTLLTARLGCADVLTRGAVICNLLDDATDTKAQLDAGINFTAALNFAEATSDEVDASSHPALATLEAYTKITSIVASPRWTTQALVDSVRHVKRTREAARQCVQRRKLGYPLRAFLAGIPEATIVASTTAEFGMYCPFTWVNKGQLISMEDNRKFTAEYVGRIYCFQAEEYLEAFLEHPEVYATSEATVTLPSTLPIRKSPEEVASVTFELYACCPVTLYDTKNNVGLKGAAEPKAIKGGLFVEYGGKFYAILDESCMERFLRQPWIFVDNAVLPMPHKLPLQTDSNPTIIKDMSPSEYITRTMYDGVARALISVAEVRPKFPGLTAEESVRKYIALHLKAFNPDNNAIAAKQYAANFEEFKQIATLYKTVGNTPPSDTDGIERFNAACELWDEVQDKPTMYEKYQYLREVHVDPESTTKSATIA